MSEDRPSRWQDLTGGSSGADYADRFATWDAQPFGDGAGYAVTVARR